MQVSYSSIRKKGCVGQKSDASPSNVISKLSRQTDKIYYGTFVVWEGNNQCRLPGSKEDVEQAALGIALHDGCGEAYKPASTISVLREGRVWVEAQADVEKIGSEVVVNFEPSLAGTFGVKEGPGAAKLKGACYTQTAKKGEVVEVEINLLGSSK